MGSTPHPPGRPRRRTHPGVAVTTGILACRKKRKMLRFLIFVSVLPAQTTLTILPGDADIRGPRAYQKLVVQATYPDGHQKDVTSGAKLVSTDPKIARIDPDAVLRPV